MSKRSTTPSLYDLAYPSEDSVFYAILLHSPIHYEHAALLDQMEGEEGRGLDRYDTSYIFREENSTCYGTPSIFPVKKALRLLSQQLIQTEDLSAVPAALQGDLVYLEMLWVRWWKGCGYSEY